MPVAGLHAATPVSSPVQYEVDQACRRALYDGLIPVQGLRLPQGFMLRLPQ